MLSYFSASSSASASSSSLVPAASSGESKEEKKSGVTTYLVLEPGRKRLTLPMEGMVESRLMLAKGRQIRVTAGAAVTMSSNGSGFVNSALSVATVATQSEFASFAVLYSEFFVHSMKMIWMPFNRYNGPTGYNTATGSSGLPLLAIPYYHAATPATLVGTAAENCQARLVNTADPFEIVWKNNEKPKSGIVVNSNPTSATPVQGWCLTAATSAAAYTGLVQFISPNVTGLPGTTILGMFLVHWDVSFREKL